MTFSEFDVIIDVTSLVTDLKINKRLQELMTEATSFHKNYCDRFGNRETTFFDQEKFAKLLIKECAGVCDRLGESGDGFTCASYIKKHFSVKQ